MPKDLKNFYQLMKDEGGATLVEYAVLLGTLFIAVTAAIGLAGASASRRQEPPPSHSLGGRFVFRTRQRPLTQDATGKRFVSDRATNVACHSSGRRLCLISEVSAGARHNLRLAGPAKIFGQLAAAADSV